MTQNRIAIASDAPPTYYKTVVSNPLWQEWGKVAHEFGYDWNESVECGWLSPKHFEAFLVWVVVQSLDKQVTP